ncbi:helix-turn-helix domain-containing protein [Lysobacter sp. CW239]|uniref:helix-turn-helix transcriptional regulator n=1 Tax=Lysobacteraceae TaxID=32033 RepID=UPI00068F1DA9|nr:MULTISPECIES: helix-turn-helix domain-containing protein [Lysobacter]QOD91958.1 helix-turn-helix domain-containing protein [Lysobacter sp. CW239]HEU4773599.1 helix-turn-helix domain-containing protein [Lysobacter sp.]
MVKRVPPTHPHARRQVVALGKRLRAARLRRAMTQGQLAERVGVSTPTIGKLEGGDPSTSLATVLRVLTVLGLNEDVDLLAAEDSLGRSLQDSQLKPPRPKSTQTQAQAEKQTLTPRVAKR